MPILGLGLCSLNLVLGEEHLAFELLVLPHVRRFPVRMSTALALLPPAAKTQHQLFHALLLRGDSVELFRFDMLRR